MAKSRVGSSPSAPRRLPRGRHALPPEEVLRDQRQRLLAAVPGAIAERGYEATSVADIVRRAAVSRNAFYGNFSDKRDCFAAAHELAHEQLLGLLREHCEPAAPLEARVEAALRAALGRLAGAPDTARLLFVEAPSSAGEQVARRYHEWLHRYGELLHEAAPREAAAMVPAEIDAVIVGGIASRIASETLQGQAARLRDLTEPLTNYVLAFYGAGQEPSATPLVALGSERPERLARQRRRAGG